MEPMTNAESQSRYREKVKILKNYIKAWANNLSTFLDKRKENRFGKNNKE